MVINNTGKDNSLYCEIQNSINKLELNIEQLTEDDIKADTLVLKSI